MKWRFELLITDTASENYKALESIAEAAVGLEGLPLNRDSRLLSRLIAVNHYEQTRKILRSIRDPKDVGLDQSIPGPFHFVRYRFEMGTCVYFTRIVTSPPLVLIYGFSDAPLDRYALRKIVLSGNAHLINKLGLPPFPLGEMGGFVN